MLVSIKDLYNVLQKSQSHWPPSYVRIGISSSKMKRSLILQSPQFKKEGEAKHFRVALIKALILQSPNWGLPLEIMWDALDYVMGVILVQITDKKQTAISYANKTLIDTQMHYTIM